MALLPFAYLDRDPSVYQDEVFFNYPALQSEFGLRPWQVGPSAPHWQDVWAYDLSIFHVVQQMAIHTWGLSLRTMRCTNLLPAVLAIAVLCAVLLESGAPVASVLLAVLWMGDRSYCEAFFSRPEGMALLGLAVSYWAALRFRRRGSLWYAATAGAAAAAAVTLHPATLLAMLTLCAACVVFAPRAARAQVFLATAAGALLPMLALGILLWPRWMESLEQFYWFAQYIRKTTPTFTRLYWFNWTLGWARAWSWLALALIPVVFAVATRRYRRASSDTNPARLAHATTVLLAASVTVALVVARPPYMWHPYFLLMVMPFELLAGLVMMGERPLAGTTSRIAIALVALTWIPSAAQNALIVRGGFYAYSLTDPAIMRQDLLRVMPRGARASVEPLYVVPAVQVGLDIDVLPWFDAGELPRDRWLILGSNRPEIQHRTTWHLNQFRPGSKWFSAPYMIVAPAARRPNTSGP
jgi:hypothetical protein